MSDAVPVQLLLQDHVQQVTYVSEVFRTSTTATLYAFIPIIH